MGRDTMKRSTLSFSNAKIMAYEIVSTVTTPDGREIVQIERMECAAGCDDIGCLHGPRGPLGPQYRNIRYITREGVPVSRRGEVIVVREKRGCTVC
jgi:hypothetical protein